jgi:enamine deaminase RidA (YjgF/YER057c/UK114 family)
MTPTNAEGIILPEPPPAMGAYSPVVIRQNIGFVSGQFPIKDGTLLYRGSVGLELDEDAGREACRLAALNVLAQIGKATNGFKSFEGLLCLEGHISSVPEFDRQPQILDVASELLVNYLGVSAGRHARTAFAPVSLPLGAPIELCVTFLAVTS